MFINTLSLIFKLYLLTYANNLLINSNMLTISYLPNSHFDEVTLIGTKLRTRYELTEPEKHFWN